MKLISLAIRNFKGIREFKFEPDGQNASLYGGNATGKTSVQDAYLWLLLGLDNTGRKDFEILPLGPDGATAQQGVAACVTAEFDLGGQRVTLRKEYAEKWVKRNGASEPVFEGHTTNHFWDGVPLSQREYQTRIAQSIAPEQALRVLSGISAFARMNWQDRRQILMDSFGGLSDAQILADSPELAQLAAAIGSYSIADYKKMLAAQRRELTCALGQLPARIDEAHRGQMPPVDTPAILAQIADKRNALAELERARAQTTDGMLAERESELRALRAQLREAESDERGHRQRQIAERDAAYNEHRARLQGKLDAANRDRREAQRLHEDAQSELAAARLRLAELRKAWLDMKRGAWSGTEVCPTCARPLPAREIAAAKAAFETNKAAAMDANAMEGRNIAAQIAALETKADTAAHDLEDEGAFADAARAELDELAAERRAWQPTQSPEHAARVADLQARASAIEREIGRLRADESGKSSAADAQTRQLSEEIARLERLAMTDELNARAAARVEELTNQQRATAADLERVEALLAQCDAFARIKAGAIEAHVNGHFRLIQFRLYETQVNGGINDTCEITVRGVPYADINEASRVNAGMEILDVLSRRYEVSLPVFIDNAERVVELAEIGAQTIRLVVSAADRELRVETERRRDAA